MSVTQIAIGRLLRDADALCHRRNMNTAVELGKCDFEPIDHGVEFYKAHYLLDSQHSEYSESVARVIYHPSDHLWWLYIPGKVATGSDEPMWYAYPYLPNSAELSCLLEEIERDPRAYFW
ncbi:DUF3024 domain-containing protein [Vibrio sp. SM6]|uniref:DUF3024 domain-containing protein n=1 Tax=Vibrio agarilyticus TaxID=2726741 RepID=A0A7X8TTJ3_9VIBR|nr:DUF3024 domain-containing protein [Vibrio agarilyticus]NLS14564.1 DUF3024 domain-containing protein [Vibrio agarilyticus]